MTKLMDYLPDYYQGVREMDRLLNGEQLTLDELETFVRQFLSNQFVTTADETGVKLMESELSIIPNSTDTLQQRKNVILLRLLPPAAITWPYFKQLIQNLNIPIDLQRDVIKQTVSAMFYNRLPTSTEIKQLQYIFNTLIPANMVTKLFTPTETQVSFKQYYGIATVIQVETVVNAKGAN